MRKVALALAALWLVTAGTVSAADPPTAGRPPAAADNQAAAGPADVSATPDEPAPGPGAVSPAAIPTPAADNQAPAGPADVSATPDEPAPGPGAVSPAAIQAPAADNQAPAGGSATGQMPAGPAARPASPRPSPPPVYLSMDFTDVDLPVLIKFISEQTRKNFIFDERVQGKITIISPRRITLDEAYNVFLSVLQVKGFATVEQDNTIKIIPIGTARQENLPMDTDGSREPGSRIITRLIPLQYVDVAEIVTLFTPLVSKDGLLTSFPASNTLIIIDSKANIDRVMRILSEIDREGTGNTLHIVALKNASVAEIAKTLDSLYQDSAPPPVAGRGGRAVRPGKARGNAPKFIPDTRTNILLILAGKEAIDEILELIAKLDIPTPENTGKINVHYLENADAEEVAKVLASFTEKRPGAAPGAPGQPAAGRGVITAELEGGVKITADKSTNSLIVIASLNDYQTLLDVIKKLDIRRRQVYVESLIMEISLDNARDLGVEFRGAFETDDGAVVGGTNFGFQGNLNELLASLATGNPLLFSGSGLIAAGIAGNVTLPDGTEVPAITAVLRAVQTRDNVNILSSPHLLTLDNKEAEIIVAENVPFITSQSRDSTNLSNVINTVERKDVGIILRLTPRINESDFVSMQIYQESSALKGGQTVLTTSTVGPTTTKRSAKTSVLVKNGDTIVLGGMMQETVNNLETKVPILGSIPILGNLFKFSSVSRKKTNLLIFLTPHIIKSPEEMGKVTNDHQREMDNFIEQHKGEVERILPEKMTGARGSTTEAK